MSEDVIRVDDRWYVLATSSRTESQTRVTKHGETFGLFDRYGDIQRIGLGEQGLYHAGTRFLSHYELTLNDRRPMLLNSSVSQDNSQCVVDMTTPDLYQGESLAIPKGTVYISRTLLVRQGVLYEHLRLVNYGEHTISIEMELRFDSDYADIFEVRGTRRAGRGRDLPARYAGNRATLGYEGLDRVQRKTHIEFSQAPETLDEKRARFAFELAPHAERELYVNIGCEIRNDWPGAVSFERACHDTAAELAAHQAAVATIFTSNEQFNDWINRSAADLQMLTTDTGHGPYPYAGVPWFSAPFGRDGIITALQYLWIDPEMARGVLAFLAAHQADKLNAAQDAEPGKILHEMRQGEMASLGEIPFSLYYGSVDATPLFVVLAGAYYQRTGDRAFIESLWPNIERAIRWMDEYGDCDGDGFIEYARHSPNGLVQQGWKDSDNSVFHHDGTLAEGPIALCEVQGYAYQALRTAEQLAALLGERDRVKALSKQANVLQKRFRTAFWCDEIGTFALALDGAKRPCRVRTSNAGHVLLSGIADKQAAQRVAHNLLSDDAFSGWGIRTVSRGEARYNPMSYHNGSVWPHDNALIAMGLARYGFKQETLRILTGLFNAAIMFDLNRLPELFCGFDRILGQGPTLYPVACAPQAWSSGTVFYLLQACLGLEFSPDKPQLRFHHPRLPDYLSRLRISNLRIGSGEVDLELRRHPKDVGINVTRKDGDIDVAVVV